MKIIGASAGAITSSLLISKVNFDDSLELAHQYSEYHQIHKNPFGFAGIWADLIRQWLNELIPPDINQNDLQNIYILATTSKSFETILLSNLQNKQELIDACLASAHLPYFMNGKFATKYKDYYFIDGSIRSYLTPNYFTLPPDITSVYKIDFRYDPHYDTIRLPGKFVSKDRAMEMMNRGYCYMQSEHQRGKLPRELKLLSKH